MNRKHKIVVTEEGKIQYRFLCHEEESLLDAIRRENIKEIPRGCGGGGCGACMIRINNGQAAMRRMSKTHIGEAELFDHIVLACCVKPRSEMTISFTKKLEDGKRL
jgi:ferredoxin